MIDVTYTLTPGGMNILTFFPSSDDESEFLISRDTLNADSLPVGCYATRLENHAHSIIAKLYCYSDKTDDLKKITRTWLS